MTGRDYFDPPDEITHTCRSCGEEMSGDVHLDEKLDLDHWAEPWFPGDEEPPELEDYMMGLLP